MAVILELSMADFMRVLQGGHVLRADVELPRDLRLVTADAEHEQRPDGMMTAMLLFEVSSPALTPIPDGAPFPRIPLRAEPVSSTKARGYEWL